MGALSIEIGGVELVDYVRQETIKIQSSGTNLAATCSFEVEDRLGQAPWINVVEKQDIIITDSTGPVRLFGGVVAYIVEEHDGPFRKWTVRGSDYTILLDSNLAALPWVSGNSDADVIEAVFAGTPIDAQETPAGYVQELRADMGDIAFAGVTLREALTDLCRKTGGSYYVDFFARLHYFAVDEGEDAPFGLSTEPDYVALYPYGDYKRSRDATKLINRVQVANYRGIEVWRDDLVSQAEPWGIQEGVVRDENINSVADAEAYGDWILSRHAWPKGEPECICWRPGLRAGMRIQLTNSVWGFGPTWYSIRRMELHCTGGTETLVDGAGHIRDPQYEIKLSMGLNDAAGRSDQEPNPDYSPAPPYPGFPEPIIDGGTVEVLATDAAKSKVYYTTDFWEGAGPTWVGASTGIPASTFHRMVLDPWETDRAVIAGGAGLYMNDAVKNGGAWSQIFSEVDFETLLGVGVTGFYAGDVHFTIAAKGFLAALVTYLTGTPPWCYARVIHSHDYGATWFLSDNDITDGVVFEFGGGDLEVSQHDPDRVWVCKDSVGPPYWTNALWRSDDGGHTFTRLPRPGSGDNGHLHIPYEDNDDDLILWRYGGAFDWIAYSLDGGATWNNTGQGTTGGALGGHNLITDNTIRGHVYAADGHDLIDDANFHWSKDDGATWNNVAKPAVLNSFAILPQATPNMVLYMGESSTDIAGGNRTAVRSSQDDGATWVDRTGNLCTLMDADGFAATGRLIYTITPDWLLPGVEEYPPPGDYYEPGGSEALTGYLTPAQHTAIGNGAPHHAPVTIGVDVEHSIVGQVLSGVDAAAAQKGHIQLAGQLGGSAASPDVRGLRETAGPTLLTLGAILDGEYLVRSGNTVIGGAAGGYEPLITGGVDPAVFILADFDLIMVAMV